MTTLSDYPGEKMPFWATSIWYRCKYCKVCFQFENQLIRHKREKHAEVIMQEHLAAQRKERNSSSANEENDAEAPSSGERTSSSSPAPIPPAIDISDALTEKCSDVVNDLSTTPPPERLKDVDEEHPVVHEGEVAEISTTEEAVENIAKFPEDTEGPSTTTPTDSQPPVVIGCALSDEEIEMSRGNSVQQVKHALDKNSSVACDFCGKTFKSISGLKRHINNCHPPPPIKSRSLRFNCPFCKKKFLSQFMKDKHVDGGCRQHFKTSLKNKSLVKTSATKNLINSGIISTNIIAKKLRVRQTLQTTVTPNPVVENKSPSKVSPTSSPVTSTAKRGRPRKEPETNAPPNPLQCEVCRKTFANRGGLLGHMRTHEPKEPKSVPKKEKGFSCKVCNLKFKQKSGFTNHLISKHSKMRNYNNQ